MTAPDSRPDWRDRLRVAVDRSHKKQSWIAQQAGISPETLSRILNAPDANPHFDTVTRIARALNVRLGWLVGEPTGVELTSEDERMLRAVLGVVESIMDAVEDGRSITFTSSPRK